MRFIQQRAVSRSASGLLCLRLAGSRGEQLLLSFSPIPKLPRVYPSVSVLPVFEKSTPDAPFFFGGGFLAAATMPAGESLLGVAVLVRAGPKERHSDGVRRSSSASRRAVIISAWRTFKKILTFDAPSWRKFCV